MIDARPGVWHAWIDSGQLENALMNLVVNARDAMQGRDGDIQLRIVNERVARSSGKQQEMVTLEVIDRGCGMTPEVRAQVFEPFFTTKAVGSGLDLPMVYGFIRQSGGKVQLDATPGQGTRVRLQLPRAPVQAPAPPQMLPIVTASEEERLVLVLEDEEDVRQTPEINLLLSDLMLPGTLSGADVIRQAMQQFPALAVLLVSGQDLYHRVDGALPFCERLAKPFSQPQRVAARRSCAR